MSALTKQESFTFGEIKALCSEVKLPPVITLGEGDFCLYIPFQNDLYGLQPKLITIMYIKR